MDKNNYKQRFAALKAGDKLYRVHATYKYPEEGGGRAGFTTSTYTVENNVVETTTRKVGNKTSETKIRYIETDSGRIDLEDVDGTNDVFIGDDDMDFALRHWDEFHNADVVTVNFWTIRRKYTNIAEHKAEYDNIQKQIDALKKKQHEIETR